MVEQPGRRWDSAICVGLVLAAFALYSVTLLPGIGTGDTAEFQWVAPTLSVAHATGYPLYTLLGWGWAHLPLGGSAAWKMNLFSAATAALAIGILYLTARGMGQRPMVGTSAVLTLGASLTYWSQATKAEIYALAALLQTLLMLGLLRWRAGRLPLWAVGLVLGLGLAHHRSIILMLPGVALFIVLTRRPALAEVGTALSATLGMCLLYLYIPLRAPDWQDGWDLLLDYISGSAAQHWLDIGRLLEEAHRRPFELIRAFIWPQLLPVGAILALSGAFNLLRSDRALAALLLTSYTAIFVFCSAYYAVDVEVFFIPAHLIAALLLGQGAMGLLHSLPPRLAPAISAILLALPALLVIRNLNDIRERNNEGWEREARKIMAQPFERGALIAGDAYYLEGLRYLQAVEGRHTDLTFSFSVDRQTLLNTLEEGRSAYLLRPAPELGLEQWPEGQLWRLGTRPLKVEQSAPDGLRWEAGLVLTGYTLRPGPYRPGDTVPLTLAWQAEAAPQQQYMIFVHLVGEDGRIWGQEDKMPSTEPTDRWRPGERYIDLYGPRLNLQTPPGRYNVIIGWYEYPSLRRLQRSDPSGTVQDQAVLGHIDVLPPGR